MRTDEVTKALQFMRSPQVKGVPLSQQIQFLEQKGLTAEEVSSVLSQLGGSSFTAAMSVPTPAKSWIASLTESVVPVAAMAAVGAAAYFLAHRVLPDPPPVQLLQELEPTEELPELEEITPRSGDGIIPSSPASSSSSDQAENLETMLTRALELLDQQNSSIQQASKEAEVTRRQLHEQTENLHKDVSVIREALAAMLPAMAPSLGEEVATQLAQKLSSSSAETARAAAPSTPPPSIKGDSAVNKLIESLRAQRQAGGSASPSESSVASPTPQAEEKEDTTEEQDDGVDVTALQEAAMNQLREALGGMVAANTHEVVVAACNQLKMYLNNILSQPDNVRYRRIYTANSMFKNSLGNVNNHQLVLEACGFERKGGNYEWAWAADWNTKKLWPVRLETLKAAVQLLNDTAAEPATNLQIEATSGSSDAVPSIVPQSTEVISDASSPQSSGLQSITP